MELFSLEMDDAMYQEASGGAHESLDAVLETARRLRSCVERIDFASLFKCNVLRIEMGARQECRQLQDSIALETNWREKMANRFIGKNE